MAKRKRLTPAQDSYLDSEMPELETKGLGVARTFTRQRPPIAQVAGEAATASALQELADEVKQAKDDGRMIVQLPLDQIEVGYLVRDRMMADEDELQVLMKSLASRGQQTPIEVVDLGQGRYGLISGWRRLTALRRLREETGEERFHQIQALIRTPDSAEAAYTAMVEENEIRVGLSYYERARIAAKAVEQEVFETEKAALQELFHAASRPKRSKIKSFLSLYHALDADLRFAHAIPERLGIALIKEISEDAGFLARVKQALAEQTYETAEEECQLLESLVSDLGVDASRTRGLDSVSQRKGQGSRETKTPAPTTDGLAQSGVELTRDGDALVLRGPGVTDAFQRQLEAWLAANRP